ncbi:MAG TPA: hypothetical protein VK158_02860 [Acidobacteriota bacterium]|nr:hypothetical protein [Acidobacteriota bacterium]
MSGIFGSEKLVGIVDRDENHWGFCAEKFIDFHKLPHVGTTVIVCDEDSQYLLHPHTLESQARTTLGPNQGLLDASFSAVSSITPYAVGLKYLGEYQLGNRREHLFEGMLVEDRKSNEAWLSEYELLRRIDRAHILTQYYLHQKYLTKKSSLAMAR